MSELVRVRLENGREVSIGREHAEANGLAVLDEPAMNGDGTVRPETRREGRPVKPHTTVAPATAEKRGTPAASSAEEASA